MNIKELFEKHNGEYLEFDRVENKRSRRPDLHAFLLLDELYPGKNAIISSAEHDEFWLDISEGQIAVMSEDTVIELARCGVRYDSAYDCLAMFA